MILTDQRMKIGLKLRVNILFEMLEGPLRSVKISNDLRNWSKADYLLAYPLRGTFHKEDIHILQKLPLCITNYSWFPEKKK